METRDFFNTIESKTYSALNQIKADLSSKWVEIFAQNSNALIGDKHRKAIDAFNHVSESIDDAIRTMMIELNKIKEQG